MIMLSDYREEIALFAAVMCVVALVNDNTNFAIWSGIVAVLNYTCYKVGV